MQKVLATSPEPTSPKAPPAAPLVLGPAEWALMVLHSMLWGSAFFFVDIAKAEIPAFTITSLRLFPAAMILVAVALALRMSLAPVFIHWRRFLVLAAINNYIPFLLIIYGQQQVTGGIAAVFNATSPLFAAFLAHALTQDEKLSINKIAGIVLGICGVAVMGAQDLFTGSSAGLLAKGALLAAAFCYAMAGIFGRSFRGTQPVVTAAGQMIWALVISLPFALLIDRPWEAPIPGTAPLLATLGMGVFGSALAAICYFTVLKRAGATNALLVTLLLPLTPILLGAVFLGQTLRPTDISGAGLIALALLVIDGRIFRISRSLGRRA